MGRNVLAVVSGYAVMFLVVTVGFVGAFGMLGVLGVDRTPVWDFDLLLGDRL